MKKAMKVIIICILMYAVFATFVIIGFYAISNNPIDKIAIPYIRQNTELQNKYGEAIWIGRYIGYKTEKEETRIRAAYSVDIDSGSVIVYVTLEKNDGKWEAVSLEEIKVISNGN